MIRVVSMGSLKRSMTMMTRSRLGTTKWVIGRERFKIHVNCAIWMWFAMQMDLWFLDLDLSLRILPCYKMCKKQAILTQHLWKASILMSTATPLRCTSSITMEWKHGMHECYLQIKLNCAFWSSWQATNGIFSCQLTVLHYNENCARSVKLDGKGKRMYRVTRKKANHQAPTPQYIREPPTYSKHESADNMLASTTPPPPHRNIILLP